MGLFSNVNKKNLFKAVPKEERRLRSKKIRKNGGGYMASKRGK